MMWVLFVMAAIGTSDLAPSRCWELPEVTPMPDAWKDTLYDSLNMRFVGSWPFGPSYAVAVDSARDLVFLGSGGGVYVLDVSTPSDPQKLSEGIHTRGVVMDLFYDSCRQNLYIADGNVSLEIWDVEDPMNPTKVGCWDNPSRATGAYLVSSGVTVKDSCAYVTDYFPGIGIDDGLHIIDISDPLNPHEVGFLAMEYAMEVAVSDSYAYVACGDYGFWAVDISDASNPRRMGQGPGGVYLSVILSDSHAYVGAALQEPYGSGLHVFDVSNPYALQVVGCCSTIYRGQDVVVWDSCAYVVEELGLSVIDVSNPQHPNLLGHYDTPGDSRGVAVLGACAYVADGGDYSTGKDLGLRIVDVSIPCSLSEMSYWQVPGWATEIIVEDSFVYLGTKGELWILDVSDPGSPEGIGYCRISGLMMDMTISGSCAYVAVSDSGLCVVDISDPAVPREIARCPTPGFPLSTELFGSHAYVGFHDMRGLYVVDVSDPSNPEGMGIHGASKVRGLVVSDSYAYCATDTGLVVFDISNPIIPREIGYCDDTKHLSNVAVSGSCAYLLKDAGTLRCDLHVFDVSNPRNPQAVGVWQRQHIAYLWDVAASNSRAYICCNVCATGEFRYSSPFVIDVSDTDSLRMVGCYVTPSWCSAIAAVQPYVYLATGDAGLQIHEFYGVGVEETSCHKPQTAMLKVCPNLAFGIVDVSYRIPTGDVVSIVVSDVAGRLIETLVNTFGERGDHSVTFDVREFPTGIYFVSMTRGSESTVTRKLTVIK